jgi:RNA polymerase sigma factor (sigma-70 family)
MSATLIENGSSSDAELVAESRRGSREAFGQIVRSYQGMVTGVIYSFCGDLHRSEDLAQETFISAWTSLSGITDPDKLSPWLCQIARRKALDSLRAGSREKNRLARLFHVPPRPAPTTPPQEVLADEERQLLWRILSQLPQPYRETLVLYYRQDKSAAAVASAMETTEEAVRQRLARGRQMLREQVAQTLERDLVRSAPGPAFAIVVLAALPVMTTSAKAAAVGATAVKGGAVAKSAGLAALCKAILGPFLAFFGIYFDYRLNRESARSLGRREFVVAFYRILVACIVIFGAAVLSLTLGARSLAMSHPTLFAGLFIGLGATYLIVVAALAVWMRRCRREIRQQEMSESGPAPAPVPLFEYRSKHRLLGLPLIHIRLRGGLERGPVKAWIAAGDAAIGLVFAFGGVAIAPISFGGLAVGLLTFGGFAIGLVALGGFSLGPWAVGGMAVGLQAFGGCAMGWFGAHGGVAVAHDFAIGGVALARHGNDAAAEAFFASSGFFQLVRGAMRYADWLNLMWLFPCVLWLWNKKKVSVIKATQSP